MPPIQEYYIISVMDSPEEVVHLRFASEIEVNGVLPVSANLKEAITSQEHLIEDKELIYIEKEKVDQLAQGKEEEGKYLHNNRLNRIELGLKYKDGILQRTSIAGEGEEYVLLLDQYSISLTGLPFLNTNDVPTLDLRKAAIHEEHENYNSIYINVEKINALATTFPDGTQMVLNTADNLKQLGLELKDEELHFIEGDSIKEEPPKAEEKEQKAKEEKNVGWMGILFKSVSFGIMQGIMQALEESNPKPMQQNSNIKALAEEIHDINRTKGFWDKKRNIGEMLMLVTSELGEGMEALRKDKKSNWIAYHQAIRDKKSPQEAFEQHIKDSFEDEIADAVIRLFDMSEGLNINLEKQIRFKMDYNRCRERFHGKTF